MSDDERHIARCVEAKYDQLSRWHKTQAEEIAVHYASLAAHAMELKCLIDIRRYSGTTPILEGLIEEHVRFIKDHHRLDFGIPLEWPERSLSSK